MQPLTQEQIDFITNKMEEFRDLNNPESDYWRNIYGSVLAQCANIPPPDGFCITNEGRYLYLKKIEFEHAPTHKCEIKLITPCQGVVKTQGMHSYSTIRLTTTHLEELRDACNKMLAYLEQSDE